MDVTAERFVEWVRARYGDLIADRVNEIFKERTDKVLDMDDILNEVIVEQDKVDLRSYAENAGRRTNS